MSAVIIRAAFPGPDRTVSSLNIVLPHRRNVLIVASLPGWMKDWYLDLPN